MRVLSPKKFKELRVASGKRQKDLWLEFNVSDVVVSRLENGHTTDPRPLTLKRLAEAYGCEIDDFYVEVKKALPQLVQRELKKRLDSVKELLAGRDGTIEEFTVEFTIKGGKYKSIKHSGRYDD